MRLKALVILLSLPICSPLLCAQNQYNLSQFANETVDFIKQPARWDGNDWLRPGLVGAGRFLVMQTDQPIRDAVMKERDFYHSAPVEFGKLWGETYSTAIIGGAFGLHGWLSKDNSTKKIGFEMVQAAFYSGATTTLLKVIVGRARPYADKGPSDYQPFTILDDGFHSLPSGHATLAFALSTVLSRNVQSNALKVIAYLPAALTAFSRVYQDYHWASDCVLSGLIGYIVATWVVDLHEQKESLVHVSSIYPLTIKISLN